MDYEEVWIELGDKLREARKLLVDTRDQFPKDTLEYKRLNDKVSGIKLAHQYWDELNDLID